MRRIRPEKKGDSGRQENASWVGIWGSKTDLWLVNKIHVEQIQSRVTRDHRASERERKLIDFSRNKAVFPRYIVSFDRGRQEWISLVDLLNSHVQVPEVVARCQNRMAHIFSNAYGVVDEECFRDRAPRAFRTCLRSLK